MFLLSLTATCQVWTVSLKAGQSTYNLHGGGSHGSRGILIQQWRDEADAVQHIATDVAHEPKLRAELDAVLDNMDVFTQAQQALPATDRAWFVETLRAELARLGSTTRYTAHLTGSGAIAQGTGAIAAGERGVAIAGDVQGGIINTGNVAGDIAKQGPHEPTATDPKE